MKPRFIAGPPGTGKTHGFIVGLYKDLLPKYHPDKLVILSHTNVAANQIREAILQIPEIKERGFTQKSMKYKICTIHSYCRNRLLRKDKFDYDDHKNLIIQDKYFNLDTESDIEKKHKFYRYISEARGHGKTLDQYWKQCNRDAFKPYNIELIKDLYKIYTVYKKDNNKCDYADMIDEFAEQAKAPDIDALIIDECQDSNVPQRKAIDKMATNVKENNYYNLEDLVKLYDTEDYLDHKIGKPIIATKVGKNFNIDIAIKLLANEVSLRTLNKIFATNKSNIDQLVTDMVDIQKEIYFGKTSLPLYKVYAKNLDTKSYEYLGTAADFATKKGKEIIGEGGELVYPISGFSVKDQKSKYYNIESWIITGVKNGASTYAQMRMGTNKSGAFSYVVEGTKEKTQAQYNKKFGK